MATPLKVLVVGDPHDTVADLEDGNRLHRLIVDTATNKDVDLIVYLGDLHHQHSIMSVEVMNTWKVRFTELARFKKVCIKGNHDGAVGDDGPHHALRAYEEMPNLFIIGSACRSAMFQASDNQLHFFGFAPHFFNNERFVEECNKKDGAGIFPILFCHQTFNGACYDNGFYAPDGVDLDCIPQKHVISGHIHTQQTVGKCWYPGSPRWTTAHDANQLKGIWLLEVDLDGAYNKTFIPSTCRQIRKVVETPADFDPQFALYENANYIVELRGPVSWIKERVRYWEGRAKIATFPEISKIADINESEGIPQAFRKYAMQFQSPNGTPADELIRLAKERCGNVL